MSLTMFALPVAVGRVAGIVMKGEGSGWIRDVILGLLGSVVSAPGHDRDGPPDEGDPSRIWPAVL
jgi:hypothetical protein